MATRGVLLCCSALVSGAMMPAAAWAQAAPADAPAQSSVATADAEDTAGIQDIVVTAQRGEESVQRVRLGVTAIDDAALRELRARPPPECPRQRPGGCRESVDRPHFSKAAAPSARDRARRQA